MKRTTQLRQRTRFRRQTPLTRQTPLRRSWFRRRHRSTRYSRRERFFEFMAIVRSLPCVASEVGRCDGQVQVDHAGRRGLGLRCHDRDVISICAHHHRQRADFAGPFKHWDQDRMRGWLADKIALTRELASGKGAIVP